MMSKSWLSSSYFILDISGVSNIIINSMFVSIYHTYFLSAYTRFVELEKENFLPLTIFIKQVLLEKCAGISFVDFTSLRVCWNQCMLIHNTFESLATRKKCFIGWFLGFKLHLIINDKEKC